MDPKMRGDGRVIGDSVMGEGIHTRRFVPNCLGAVFMGFIANASPGMMSCNDPTCFGWWSMRLPL